MSQVPSSSPWSEICSGWMPFMSPNQPVKRTTEVHSGLTVSLVVVNTLETEQASTAIGHCAS